MYSNRQFRKISWRPIPASVDMSQFDEKNKGINASKSASSLKALL